MTEETPEQIRAWLVRLDLALAGIGERLDQVESALDDAIATDDLPHAAPRDWQFRTVYDWVEEWFVRAFARSSLTGVRWCPYWWEHVEALTVLTAMWRSWEVSRRDRDTGMARWLHSCAYPLLRELWDGAGTFRNCTATSHVAPAALPYVSAPDRDRGQR